MTQTVIFSAFSITSHWERWCFAGILAWFFGTTFWKNGRQSHEKTFLESRLRILSLTWLNHATSTVSFHSLTVGHHRSFRHNCTAISYLPTSRTAGTESSTQR